MTNKTPVLENNSNNATLSVPIADVGGMSGIEKAAILLLSLSESDAASIIKHLDPKQMQKIGVTMTSMNDYDHLKVTGVHQLFLEEIQKFSAVGFNSETFIRNTLTTALGKDKAQNLIEQILATGGAHGMESLKWMDSGQISSIIKNEHPQIQSIVLSFLEPDQAAEILEQFPEKNRLDIVTRIAKLDEIQPTALQELNSIMEKQFIDQGGSQAAKMGGMQTAANIMNLLEPTIENHIMENIREADASMAQKIQDLMFVFDNLMDVDDRGIQAILRDTETDALTKALKGADESLRDKLLKNMSKRAAEMLLDDLEAMGPIRVSEVEAAQKDILATARKLADAGEVMLGGGGGDGFV